MTKNLRAGTYPPHKLSTEMKWVDLKGCAHLFALPVSYRDMLCERLAASYSLNEANLATRLACMIVAMDVKLNGAPFPLCRRGLSGQDREDGKPRHLSDVVKALGFTEWHARIAIRALRSVCFIEEWSQRIVEAAKSSWALWRRLNPFNPKRGKDWNKSMLRRAANLYTVGDEFVRAALAERKRRSQIAGRKAVLKYRIHNRTQDDAIEAESKLLTKESLAGSLDSEPVSLFGALKILPDTQQEDTEEALKGSRTASLDESPTTLGGKSPFAGLGILKAALAAAMQTKAGDDLSGFAPVGPPPSRPPAPSTSEPEPDVPTLRPVTSRIHPWSPMEAIFRDWEEAVLNDAEQKA